MAPIYLRSRAENKRLQCLRTFKNLLNQQRSTDAQTTLRGARYTQTDVYTPPGVPTSGQGHRCRRHRRLRTAALAHGAFVCALEGSRLMSTAHPLASKRSTVWNMSKVTTRSSSSQVHGDVLHRFSSDADGGARPLAEGTREVAQPNAIRAPLGWCRRPAAHPLRAPPRAVRPPHRLRLVRLAIARAPRRRRRGVRRVRHALPPLRQRVHRLVALRPHVDHRARRVMPPARRLGLLGRSLLYQPRQPRGFISAASRAAVRASAAAARRARRGRPPPRPSPPPRAASSAAAASASARSAARSASTRAASAARASSRRCFAFFAPTPARLIVPGARPCAGPARCGRA